MKIKIFTITVLSLLLFQSFAFANRELNRAEILQIFQILTEQPRRTWISAGTINADHQEYKASDGYITDSTVTVVSDGDKFYWEINIDSHIKQTAPYDNLRNAFDIGKNKKRIFAWDGQRYTMYFQSGNNAIVNESSGDIPVAVNGPLTAGMVPWGYGIYTYEKLSAAQSSAVVDDKGQLRLTLNNTNLPEIVLELDPEKNYAVLSCSINNGNVSSIVQNYGNFELVSNKWVPITIAIEQYDNSKQNPEIISYDYWTLTSVSPITPQADSFDVAYEVDTLVEYYSPVSEQPLLYHYRPGVDTDMLLNERIANILSEDTQTQNCATITMKYVAEQVGKEVTDEELAGLVDESSGKTSLYSLRQFAENLGLFCLAAKTDIQTLSNLNNCRAILHLPGPNHYVVLDHIDDSYVWIIDPDSNKFYYRTKIDLFDLDWAAGTALLISNKPLSLEGNLTELNYDQLQEISGSMFGNYDCTDLIQEYNIAFCSPPIGTLCGGRYQTWYNRYGCELISSSGSCYGDSLVGSVYSYCVLDPETLITCKITGTWYSTYIHACQ